MIYLPLRKIIIRNFKIMRLKIVYADLSTTSNEIIIFLSTSFAYLLIFNFLMIETCLPMFTLISANQLLIHKCF